jgi:4-hydroxy-2-oxoheptanedioate aldolase
MDSSSVQPGAWCVLGETGVASALATAGFDWVCLDAQHGLFDRAAVAATLARRTDAWCRVLVRAPANDAAFIGAALDCGATGVIVPLIESVEAARSAVAAALYPPLGRRSWGPLAPLWQATAPGPDAANAAAEVWVMIETAAGLAAVDEILATPGLTGVLVGPYDLSLGLGLTREAMLDARGDTDPLPSITRAARSAGIRTAAFGGGAELTALLDPFDFDAIAVTTDAAALAAGAAMALGRTAGGSSC